MSLCMFVGNAMKDLVCSPRPFGTPYGATLVKCLGSAHEEAKKNAQEYGLPSSHTMNSICFNFYLVHYLFEKELVDAETTGEFHRVPEYHFLNAWQEYSNLSSCRLQRFSTPLSWFGRFGSHYLGSIWDSMLRLTSLLVP